MDITHTVRFSRVAANGIELHIAEAGPAEGPLVFLLHGFPEFWYGWRNQIPALAENGFRVIAPDQRGYNLSDKPDGVPSYHLDRLAADIVGLADHFKRDSFSVVGHDWGAAVGWWLAGKYAPRVQRLAVLNAPHPAVWVDAMRNNPVQKRKSSYVRFFQLPLLPELLLRLGNYAAMAKGFRDSIRTGAFTDLDLRRYRNAWSQPGALTATINWYRAILKTPPSTPDQYRISSPALLIWGMRDAYAGVELAEKSVGLCSNGRLVRLDQSTHWVQHDEPDHVANLLIEFLKA